MTTVKTFEINSAAAMEKFGGAIAAAATADEITVYLSGDLAAGKTTLARGYLRRLGHPGAVKSPTFTLVESYELNGRSVHHFDLYRLEDPEELEYIGLDEYFEAGADCLIEWPERGIGALPVPDLNIRLEVRGTARRAQVTAETENGNKLLENVDINFVKSLS
jgi:tRNA threonylcarbamoyladenosine biosynthesis protein TsaE